MSIITYASDDFVGNVNLALGGRTAVVGGTWEQSIALDCNGILRLDGTGRIFNSTKGVPGGAALPVVLPTDNFTISADVMVKNLRSKAGLMLYFGPSAANRFLVGYLKGEGKVAFYVSNIGDVVTDIFNVYLGYTYSFKVYGDGKDYRLLINDSEVLSVSQSSFPDPGYPGIAIYSHNGSSSMSTVGNFIVTGEENGTQPNGGDGGGSGGEDVLLTRRVTRKTYFDALDASWRRYGLETVYRIEHKNNL